ncbi:MAG: O-antigen ligase family protein [Gemmatimonadales bacterium]
MRRTLVFVAGAMLLSALAAAQPSLVALGPAVVLAALAWRWPDAVAGVVAFAALALRPTLDAFSERRLGLGPLAIQPAAAFGAAVLLVGCVLAVRRFVSSRPHPLWPDAELRRAHLFLAAAVAIQVFSAVRLFGASGLAEGVREISRVASIVLAFLVIWWWIEARPGRARIGWKFLLAGLVPPILFAGWQLVTGRGFWEPGSGLRIQGTFSHPNSFAQYLAPFILIAVAGIPAAPLHGKIWRAAGALGLAVLLMLTYSRTAIAVVGTALGALVLLFLYWRGVRGLRPALAVLAFLGLAWLVVGEEVQQRFAPISLRRAIEQARVGRSQESFGWRLLNWRGLVVRGVEHPVLGHGANMTTRLNPLVNENNGIPFNAHNDFVRFFFEAGIVGLVCYGLYGLLLCLWAVRRARSVGAEAAALAATLAAMLFFTAGMTELSLHTANQYVLYGMLALIYAPGVSSVRGESAGAEMEYAR